MSIKLSYKTALPFIIILIFLSTFSAYLIMRSNEISSLSDRLDELVNQQNILTKFDSELYKTLMFANDFIITSKKDYGVRFKKSFQELKNQFNEIQKFNWDAERKNILISIPANLDSIKTISDKIFTINKSISSSEVIYLMEKMDYDFGEDVSSRSYDLQAYISTEILKIREILNEYQTNTFYSVYGLGTAIVLFSILIIYLSVRYLTKPILSLVNAAKKISIGDYSVKPRIGTHDELELLSNAFISMTESISSSFTLLDKSKKFNESIVNTMPSGLIVVRKGLRATLGEMSFTNAQIVQVNDSFTNMFGKPNSECVGKNLKEVLAEINLSEFCKRMITDGKVIKGVECECVSPKNGKRILNISMTGFELGEENMLIVLDDITELKEIEQRLRIEKEKSQKYLDIAGVMFVVINKDRKIELINRKGCEILGYEENEIVGKDWFYTFLPHENREQVINIFTDIINGHIENVEYFENHVVTKKGEKRLIAWHNTLLQNSSGEIICTVSSGTDITEEREAVLALKKYAKEMKELNAQKDKLFSIISHDLRSPFNGLLGYAEILESDIDNLEKSEIHNFASNIREIGSSILNHLNKLLEWSRLQRGKIEIKPERILLKQYVDEIINLLNPNAVKKKIKINIDVDSKLYVKADEQMLTSVLQNIVSNAIKFTDFGGQINILANSTDSKVEVTIEDNGVGMTDEELGKIFQIDTHFTKRGTADEEGTGLGLVICKEMIEKQEGCLRVESEKGKGSKFIFTLPKESEV